jgi:hypothetical protein
MKQKLYIYIHKHLNIKTIIKKKRTINWKEQFKYKSLNLNNMKVYYIPKTEMLDFV